MFGIACAMQRQTTPFMGVSRAECQPLLHKPKRGSTAFVDGFEAARVIPKEGALGRKKRRVKGPAAGPHEDRCIFEKMKLLWRKAESSSPRWEIQVDASQQEITAEARSMAEFGVEWQGV